MQTFLRIITRQRMLFLLLITTGMAHAQINFSLPGNTPAGNITRAEYYFDTDPGFGAASALPVSPSLDLIGVYSINISGLVAGSHRLSVRTQDAAGHWSLVNTAPLYVVPPPFNLPANTTPGNIVKAEYFFDIDPGLGSAVNIPITAAIDLSGTYTVNLTGLTTGPHHLFIRTQDVAGHWSLTNQNSFYIVPPGFNLPANTTPGNIISAEYFFDTDPGFGNGTLIAVTAATDITSGNIAVNLSGLSNGPHRLYARTKDAAGRWSLANLSVFSIVVSNVSFPPNPVPGNLTKLEYFFDTDPGFGNGKSILVAATTDLNNYTFAADISSLQTETSHTLYVRTFDAWSTTIARTFMIGAALPVTWLSFSAQLQADSVLLNWQTATEQNNDRYLVERSTDGTAFKQIGSVSGNGTAPTRHAYKFTDHQPLEGISYYRLKQVDADGHFTYSAIIKVNIALASSVTVYPNPAKDIINVSFDKVQPADAQMKLYSYGGQLLQTVPVGGLRQKQLAANKLAAGIYHLTITTSNMIVMKQIIINR